MRMMVIPALLVALSSPMPATAQVQIDHAAVSCAVAERFPRLEARVVPPDAVARAVVHFRTASDGPWYAVTMKRDGEALAGVLPKPKKTLPAFQYYIDVTDRAFATSRTPEYRTIVVSGPGGCQGKMMAGALTSASVLIEGPAGAAVVPAGFGSAGVTAAGSGTAASTAAGVTGGGGGGGLGTGAVVGIVAGGAAVAAAAVVASGGGGGEDGSTNGGGGGGGGTTPGGGSAPPGGGGTAPGGGGGTPFYSVRFPLPGIDVSPCAGRQLSWTGQAVTVDASGRFDTTWSVNEPGLVRVTGTVTDTAFNASLACTSGGTTGTISASGSGGTYQGTFRFGSSSGSVTVTRETIGGAGTGPR
jgi:hypothetical protein